MAKENSDKIPFLWLYQASKSPREIQKLLNVNRMPVWRMLKRLKETGKVMNRPGQGCALNARTKRLIKATREKLRRDPKRSIRNLTQQSNVSIGTISTILHKDLKTSPYKH